MSWLFILLVAMMLKAISINGKNTNCGFIKVTSPKTMPVMMSVIAAGV